MTGDNDTQREIGRLAGAIEAGFQASRERYDDMGQQLAGIRADIKETNQSVKALDECVDKRTDTLASLMEAQHKAAFEATAALRKEHGERLTTLEHDKAMVTGGWKALVVTWGGAIGASGATVGALKLLGLIR